MGFRLDPFGAYAASIFSSGSRRGARESVGCTDDMVTDRGSQLRLSCGVLGSPFFMILGFMLSAAVQALRSGRNWRPKTGRVVDSFCCDGANNYGIMLW